MSKSLIAPTCDNCGCAILPGTNHSVAEPRSDHGFGFCHQVTDLLWHLEQSLTQVSADSRPPLSGRLEVTSTDPLGPES